MLSRPLKSKALSKRLLSQAVERGFLNGDLSAKFQDDVLKISPKSPTYEALRSSQTRWELPSTINTAGLQIHLYKDSWHREPIFADHGHLIYQQGHK